MKRPQPLAVALAAVLAVAGCGSGGDPELAEVDELQGTYEGVGLGDSQAEVVAAFGETPALPGARTLLPVEVEVDNHGSPGCPRGVGEHRTLRYSWGAFGLLNDEVCALVVVEDRVATHAGVAVGDSLDDAEAAYPSFECGRTQVGEGVPVLGPSTVPYCSGRIAAERHLWFGGDPINVIELNTTPLRG